MNLKEAEINKLKNYNKLILIILLVIILLMVLGVFIIKLLIDNLFEDKYYTLNVDYNNRNEIISLLEKEEIDYCDSINKMEYIISFPHSSAIKIYCELEEDIKIKNENNELKKYILTNGIYEKR